MNGKPLEWNACQLRYILWSHAGCRCKHCVAVLSRMATKHHASAFGMQPRLATAREVNVYLDGQSTEAHFESLPGHDLRASSTGEASVLRRQQPLRAVDAGQAATDR